MGPEMSLDEPQSHLWAFSDEDKKIIIYHVQLFAMLSKDGTMPGNPAQCPGSTLGLRTGNLGRLEPLGHDSEGAWKQAGSSLNKLLHDVFRCFPRLAAQYQPSVIGEKQPRDPMAVAWDLNPAYSEAILGKHPRREVPVKDVIPGSLLRGVVKIIVTLCGGDVVTGTGVLIDEWTVATVGHVLIDSKGHAEEIVILAGEGGGTGNIESRAGVCVAVHYWWFDQSKRSEPNDLGFIRLSRPFKTVIAVTYRQTPITDGSIIGGIYGYPYDMGDGLCLSESPIKYNPSRYVGMLEHEGDTEKGSSGGPVLDTERRVIALHRGWDYKDGEKINKAVPIDRDGNDFAAFFQVLAYMVQHNNGHICSNGVDEAGSVNFVAQRECENIKVEVVGPVEKVRGLAFAW